MTDVKIELVTSKEGWNVFNLVSFGAEIERKVGPGEYPPKKKIHVTLETPSEQVNLIAIQQHPGAGPQPENTLSLLQVQELLANMVRYLEASMDDVYTDDKSEKGSW